MDESENIDKERYEDRRNRALNKLLPCHILALHNQLNPITNNIRRFRMPTLG